MTNSRMLRSLAKPAAMCMAGLLLFSAPVLSEDLIEREELQRGDVDANGKTEAIMARIRMMPGASIPLHTHPGDEFVYVIAGGPMETSQGNVVDFPTGANLRFPRGEVHGGVTSRADGEIVLLTVHVVDKGKPMNELVE